MKFLTILEAPPQCVSRLRRQPVVGCSNPFNCCSARGEPETPGALHARRQKLDANLGPVDLDVQPMKSPIVAGAGSEQHELRFALRAPEYDRDVGKLVGVADG
jgi:hypothetical protein